MGLTVLLARGIQAIRAERARLDAQVGVARAAAAIAALENLPALLAGLNQLAFDERATPRARAALTVVVAYGFTNNDLLPAVGDQELLGVFDDAYLAFFAAAHIHGESPGVKPADIATGVAALRDALPADIVPQLERQLVTALDEIETLAEATALIYIRSARRASRSRSATEALSTPRPHRRG